jgi:hypothetical protein
LKMKKRNIFEAILTFISKRAIFIDHNKEIYILNEQLLRFKCFVAKTFNSRQDRLCYTRPFLSMQQNDLT